MPTNSLALWFYQSSARVLISDAVSLLSTLSFVLFLVALSHQTAVGQNVDERQARLVRKAARIAAFVAGATLILGIAFGVQHQSVMSAASIVRGALFDLPAFIAPWIIYSSIRTSRKTTDAGPLSAALDETG